MTTTNLSHKPWTDISDDNLVEGRFASINCYQL
jgi:hypothetical protein